MKKPNTKKQITIPPAILAKMTSEQVYCIERNSDFWDDEWVEELQTHAPYLVPRQKDLTERWKSILADILNGVLDASEGLLTFRNYFYDTWHEAYQAQQILEAEYKHSKKDNL